MPFKSLEKTLTEASALVRLIDGFTGEVATLPVKLDVTSAAGNDGAAGKVDFVTKRSGEYGFVDLASGEYEVSWESKYFFPPSDDETQETFTYDAVEGYKGPKVVTLQPRPSYPFPPGATLLRGVVIDAAEKLVKGASVSVVERPEFNSETDDNGEFVLFFKDLKYTEENDSDFYKDGDGTYYVVPKGGSEVDIELSVKAAKGAETGEVNVKVIAEKANTLGTDGNPIKIILST
jgi:hypothetical protein